MYLKFTLPSTFLNTLLYKLLHAMSSEVELSQLWGARNLWVKMCMNQTVNDGVAHSKNPRKCAYHVTFDPDL